MQHKYSNKFICQKGAKAPEGAISEVTALGFGKLVDVESGDGIFPPGEEGACYDNSLNISYKKRYNALYCLGFAAGGKGDFSPHAWVSRDGKYYEVSPQKTGGQKYVLCFEEKFEDIESLVKEVTNSDIWCAPMISLDGRIVIPLK
jgi:hypothetical protein